MKALLSRRRNSTAPSAEAAEEGKRPPLRSSAPTTTGEQSLSPRGLAKWEDMLASEGPQGHSAPTTPRARSPVPTHQPAVSEVHSPRAKKRERARTTETPRERSFRSVKPEEGHGGGDTLSRQFEDLADENARKTREGAQVDAIVRLSTAHPRLFSAS